ncbi:hypothetical protein COT98_01390 [Candidatus Falkowbacteria bacterium CG10_big_fil_rev_8_21_14_0_10_39_9]|uniref:Uncharacterized protein n=1 Tax=Candidatus Falkowbacteria bacterium CG10_big_fil_rev_8_21_14_0_10_39_9 TaxID=1974566 RepID=A0A2M6WQF8_9BACT|nr:MAG: hypothetical protein COT98_01390 [Candidatus Falkowbacteria bacterium CG10_big_fil_rev_8_21_14_0_10_39_9]
MNYRIISGLALISALFLGFWPGVSQAACVDPRDAKRYYMADGTTAYDVMRLLGLGITNQNLETISIGQL